MTNARPTWTWSVDVGNPQVSMVRLLEKYVVVHTAVISSEDVLQNTTQDWETLAEHLATNYVVGVTRDHHDLDIECRFLGIARGAHPSLTWNVDVDGRRGVFLLSASDAANTAVRAQRAIDLRRLTPNGAASMAWSMRAELDAKRGRGDENTSSPHPSDALLYLRSFGAGVVAAPSLEGADESLRHYAGWSEFAGSHPELVVAGVGVDARGPYVVMRSRKAPP